MLYSKQHVYYNDVSIDRRNQNGDGLNTATLSAAQIVTLKKYYATDLNIKDRISKIKNLLKNENIYGIPLTHFTDLGKINFPTNIDYTIKCHLETEIKKLFESRKVLTPGSALPTPDVKIIFTQAPFVQYEQILLDKNFRQYLETITVSKKKNLRMVSSKNTHAKSIQNKCWLRHP